jgi:pyruvate dehydrogenase E2 component (dihydrolipoamide acetyltransferase)
VAVEIVMPHLSDSMEDGTIVSWLVAEGDAVKEGDPLVEVETDKATVTYESEHDGTVLKLAAGEGEVVGVGAVIATLGKPGESVAPAVEKAAAATAPPAALAGGRVKASPLARRVAASLGVDLVSIAGSGPQGRVIKADVERHAFTAVARGNGTQLLADNGGQSAPANGSQVAAAKGAATVQSLSRLQQTIARRMSESRSTVPDFELRRQFDMSAVVALREEIRAVAERAPSYNDFMVKAAALALREFPRVNGSYRDGVFETYGRVNVGIAVAAEDALVVPTVFDADRKSLTEISETVRELAAKVHDGSVTPAELSGSTFSISNLGMYGVDGFSAVINPPQAAILAIGSLKPRPVVAEDGVTIVAKPTVHVSLACDHRILYGADGARFLARLDELLQSPMRLLL